MKSEVSRLALSNNRDKTIEAFFASSFETAIIEKLARAAGS